MGNKEKRKELRKHKRVYAQHGAVAALEESKSSLKIGLIANISKGGLAFNYIGKKEKISGWHKADIFLSSKRFYLKEVLFKATSDFYIDPQTPFSTVLMKQCGGEFGELTEEQKSQLDYFLKNHTID